MISHNDLEAFQRAVISCSYLCQSAVSVGKGDACIVDGVRAKELDAETREMLAAFGMSSTVELMRYASGLLSVAASNMPQRPRSVVAVGLGTEYSVCEMSGNKFREQLYHTSMLLKDVAARVDEQARQLAAYAADRSGQ